MSVMTLNQYQIRAQEFAKYGKSLEYPFLALGEEAGEVLGKLAKFVRKHEMSVRDAVRLSSRPSSPFPEDVALRADLQKELGDVLWQLQACASELSMTLEDIAQLNLDKLSGRAERGTIVGEGDER